MFPNKEIQLAWTIEVDVAELGARFEAYNATHDQIDVLYSARNLEANNLLSRLPNEVLNMVATALRDIAYQTCLGKLQQKQRCCDNECNEDDHLTEEDSISVIKIRELKQSYNNLPTYDGRLREALAMELVHWERNVAWSHNSILDAHIEDVKKFTSLGAVSAAVSW